jgi:transcriptional regulator with XRE-family HTH domain
MSLESLAILIRDRMQREALSQRSTAARIGITQTTLIQLLKARSMPKAATRTKVAVWLGLAPPRILQIINGQSGLHTAMAFDPIAVGIHKAGKIARHIALAAIDAERRYAVETKHP